MSVIASTLTAKGIGEAGCVASPPAVINAVLDALKSLGVDHIDMPATPAKVWERNAAACPGGVGLQSLRQLPARQNYLKKQMFIGGANCAQVQIIGTCQTLMPTRIQALTF
jgi:hypothetical protein